MLKTKSKISEIAPTDQMSSRTDLRAWRSDDVRPCHKILPSLDDVMRVFFIVISVQIFIAFQPVTAWSDQLIRQSNADTVSSPKSDFVTSSACAACHAEQSALWQKSHHAVAMQHAIPETVLAPFEGETFSKATMDSTFFKRDDKFIIRTDGPDGKLSDFEVAYTFGVSPLQQYLITLPGGRLQAFGIAWDTRQSSEGGERWFDLYPDQELSAGDPLHWTGIDQNWNYQCAWCHSTNLQKNFDPLSGDFATTWSDIDVGCEACHGPGADHIAWANQPPEQRDPDKRGLTVRFDERNDATWMMHDRGTAVRSAPRQSNIEINICAGCHSRREQFDADPHNNTTFMNGFRPSLLERGLYFPDGQQWDEVYKYGSFLQSKMHAEGVTCSDCHEPHSGELIAQGNALCSQCHLPEKFDAARHHHHDADSAGADCKSCHMPATNYMIVDERHDHSFRIPKPSLSETLDLPNACNRCHSDRDASWAAVALNDWYPNPKKRAQDFAEHFAAVDSGSPGSREALIDYLEQQPRPAMVTASALARLSLNPSIDVLRLAVASAQSPDASVRAEAITVLAQAPATERLKLLAPLLDDEVRLVRMDAARALVGEPEAGMSTQQKRRFEAALDDYLSAQHFNAERPEVQALIERLQVVEVGSKQAFDNLGIDVGQRA